jgi:hypothetical protein
MQGLIVVNHLITVLGVSVAIAFGVRGQTTFWRQRQLRKPWFKQSCMQSLSLPVGQELRVLHWAEARVALSRMVASMLAKRVAFIIVSVW